MTAALPRLHLITDDAVIADPSFPEIAERVLERCGGGAALHLRGPGTTGARLHAAGGRLATATLRTGAWLIVNDRVDIALAVRANGVQLSARSLSVSHVRSLLGAGARIGCSVHHPAGAAQAEAGGADFVVLGTIYESASHAGRAPAGVAAVRAAVDRTSLPVIAIGGMTAARAVEVARMGAHGIAVLGGVWRVPDPPAAAAAYADSVRDAWAEDRTS